MFKNLRLEKEGTLAILTIDRPDRLNAIDNATVEEIDSALTDIETDKDLRVLILTGAGEKAFVAGADIRELSERDRIDGRRDTRRRQEVYTRIEQLEIPSIAAINGFAFGTGLELAMACTFRIASATAKLGQPEVKLGIIPGAGATQRLPLLVGRGAALEMILTGEPITAEHALKIGLVHRVVLPNELLDECRTLVQTLTSRPRLALQYGKEAVMRAGEGSLAEGLAHESYLHALACASDDKREGIAAFLEKRAPRFTGR
jgi:enoyl-CoA hydratase